MAGKNLWGTPPNVKPQTYTASSFQPRPVAPMFSSLNPTSAEIHQAVKDRVKDALLDLMPGRGRDPNPLAYSAQHVVQQALEEIRCNVSYGMMQFTSEVEVDMHLATVAVSADVTLGIEPIVRFQWKINFGSPFTDKRLKGFGKPEDEWDAWPLDGGE
jgi:hypothetical protein